MAAAAAPGEECILLLLLFLLFLRKVIALSRNSHGGWRISSLSLVLLRHPYFLSPCGFFLQILSPPDLESMKKVISSSVFSPLTVNEK